MRIAITRADVDKMVNEAVRRIMNEISDSELKMATKIAKRYTDMGVKEDDVDRILMNKYGITLKRLNMINGEKEAEASIADDPENDGRFNGEIPDGSDDEEETEPEGQVAQKSDAEMTADSLLGGGSEFSTNYGKGKTEKPKYTDFWSEIETVNIPDGIVRRNASSDTAPSANAGAGGPFVVPEEFRDFVSNTLRMRVKYPNRDAFTTALRGKMTEFRDNPEVRRQIAKLNVAVNPDARKQLMKRFND